MPLADVELNSAEMSEIMSALETSADVYEADARAIDESKPSKAKLAVRYRANARAARALAARIRRAAGGLTLREEVGDAD